MKCLACGKDCTKKERPERKCPHCHATFVFEPTDGDRVTDARFDAALRAASADYTVKFTMDHVYYQLAARGRDAAWRPLPVPTLVAVVSLSVLFGAAVAATLATLVDACLLVSFVPAAGIALFVAWRFAGRNIPRPVFLEKEEFGKMWGAWVKVHGDPKGLIRPARRPPATARDPVLEAEIRSYSFDRAVVCDTATTVDVLLANRFHFENNCAVLSVGGHPAPAFETVRAMLRNNPKLRVYCLHDATPEGCGLAERLRKDPKWFGGTDTHVVDVGVRPRHAHLFDGRLLPASTPVRANAAVTPAEAAWLSEWRIELAAVPPEQLVKRLYRAIVADESGAAGGADGSSAVAGASGGSIGDPASASDGGADSFG